MHDALFVRRFERLGDLFRDPERIGKLDRAPRDVTAELIALDELHGERSQVRCFFESVDGSDVRMIERGEHLCLALKPRQPVQDRRRHPQGALRSRTIASDCRQ